MDAYIASTFVGRYFSHWSDRSMRIRRTHLMDTLRAFVQSKDCQRILVFLHQKTAKHAVRTLSVETHKATQRTQPMSLSLLPLSDRSGRSRK